MSAKRYGTTKEEASALDTQKCHQIVKTITDFGITEHQKLKLIYLLALELENRDALQEITGLVKRIETSDYQKSTLITELT
jgi:hypothetical protein